MMLAQQAGPLEREAEETTFHSWPAAPLPTSPGLPAWHHPSSQTDPHLHQHRQHAGLGWSVRGAPLAVHVVPLFSSVSHFLRGMNVPGLVPVLNRDWSVLGFLSRCVPTLPGTTWQLQSPCFLFCQGLATAWLNVAFPLVSPNQASHLPHWCP